MCDMTHSYVSFVYLTYAISSLLKKHYQIPLNTKASTHEHSTNEHLHPTHIDITCVQLSLTYNSPSLSLPHIPPFLSFSISSSLLHMLSCSFAHVRSLSRTHTLSLSLARPFFISHPSSYPPSPTLPLLPCAVGCRRIPERGGHQFYRRCSNRCSLRASEGQSERESKRESERESEREQERERERYPERRAPIV